jgi:hypothetical protein
MPDAHGWTEARVVLFTWKGGAPWRGSKYFGGLRSRFLKNDQVSKSIISRA